MNKAEAIQILINSIAAKTDLTIRQVATKLVNKFIEGPRPIPGSTLKLNINVIIETDLLYRIEEHLQAKENGRKRYRRKRRKK